MLRKQLARRTRAIGGGLGWRWLLLPPMLALRGGPSLPFTCGERLSYSAHAGPGLNGHAEMWVEGPVEYHGSRVFTLNSDVHGGFGPFHLSERVTSWFDTGRMASVHFTKDEHTPFDRASEDVDIDPAKQSWRAADGRTGNTPSAQPLDELSMLYVLRTLSLPPDSVVQLNRHFDPERNPTRVRLIGTGTVKTPAGTWAVIDVEMQVRDPRRYRGDGIIRVSLSDDACRRPVRIESRIPGSGTIVLELLAAEPELPGCTPQR